MQLNSPKKLNPNQNITGYGIVIRIFNRTIRDFCS